VAKRNAPLEGVSVVPRILARRIGHAELLAEFGDKKLAVDQFGAVGMLPRARKAFGERVMGRSMP